MYINCLELLAATLAVKSFAKGEQDITIHLKMDNTTAIAYLNKFGGTLSPTNETVLDMVPGQEYKPTSHPSFRHPEHNGRRGISGDEGQDRLDALSSCLPGYQSPNRTTSSGPNLHPD